MHSTSGLITCLLLPFLLYNATSVTSIEDADHAFHHGLDATEQVHEASQAGIPNHKDRVLLRDVKTLTFNRNRRTTSRRTHSIHQLSCVGGTAGCKLFTPSSVECYNMGIEAGNIQWKCHADMSDRVKFNHVEVICEGYDYAEDDYILVGSCGLEFTLDYTDPHDYHEKSYFKHMDEHEKELHHERVRQLNNRKEESGQQTHWLQQVSAHISANIFYIVSLSSLILISFTLARYLSPRGKGKQSQSSKDGRPVPSYGPLTSAVMTTKKAC